MENLSARVENLALLRQLLRPSPLTQIPQILMICRKLINLPFLFLNIHNQMQGSQNVSSGITCAWFMKSTVLRRMQYMHYPAVFEGFAGLSNKWTF